MKDSLVRSRRWIYLGLGVLSLAALCFPTMVLNGANFWFRETFSYGWYTFLWIMLLVVPVCALIINAVPGRIGSNDRLNSILFGFGMLFTFVLYPIFMKLALLNATGAEWANVRFYLGIGTILCGIFLTLGFVFALWSIVDAKLAKNTYKETVKSK